VRAGVSSAWIGKWQTREAQWHDIVADLRARLAAAESGSDGAGARLHATLTEAQGEVERLRRGLATAEADGALLRQSLAERDDRIRALEAASHARGSMAEALTAGSSANLNASTLLSTSMSSAPVTSAAAEDLQRRLTTAQLELDSARATVVGFKGLAAE